MIDYLKVVNFSCGYKNGFIINNVSFCIEKNIICGIIGPNGSGKTTLLKGLSGVLKPFSGEIYIEGKNFFAINRKMRALLISVVPQNINPASMTVEEYVLMGRLPYQRVFQFFETSIDLAVARKYMKKTGIYSLKDKYLDELSGGELQLAAISKALTQEPQILILDEPTAHLDILHQVKIMNLLQNLVEDLKLTIILTLHDLNLASEYCDKLILMNKGTIYSTGKPEEVLTYENIEEVYKTVVVTLTNPLSKKPFISIVSEKILKKYL